LRIHIILTITAAVLCTGAVCGGKPEPVDDATYLQAAQTAAAAAHLTVADMPAGWSGLPQEPDIDEPLPAGFAPKPGCELVLEEADYPGATYETESDEFGVDEDEALSTTVGVYRSDTAADLGQGAIDHVMDNCRDDLVRFLQGYASQSQPGYIWEFSLEYYDAPDHGDWSIGQVMRLKATGAGGQFEEYTYRGIVIRQGRVLGTIEWFETEHTGAEVVDSLTTLFADRLAQADASLPN
jgi:hypothetical protein